MQKQKYTAHIYAPITNENNNITALRVGRYDGYRVDTKYGPLFIADTATKKHNKSMKLYTVSDLDTGMAIDFWRPTIADAIAAGIAKYEKLGDNLAQARHAAQHLIATTPIEKVPTA